MSVSAREGVGDGRLHFLDVIRGAAAFGVLTGHALEMSVPGYLAATLRDFYPPAVFLPLFMLVSGFVIPASLERGGSNRRFWLSRFWRLYPLYWLNLGLLLLLFRLVPPPGAFEPRRAWHWLANLTMLQEFAGVPHANPVFWTLTAELIFYGLCSVLFALGWLKRSCLLAWTGVVGLVLAGTAWPLLLHRRFPAGYAVLFVSALVGAVFYRVDAGQVPRRRLTMLLAAVLAATAWVGYLNFEVFPRAVQSFSFRSVFASWASAFAVFVVLFRHRGRHVPRLFVGLGVISYSVYLMHPAVLWLLPRWPAPLFVPAALLCTLALASATYWLVERPGMRLGRALTRRGARAAVQTSVRTAA